VGDGTSPAVERRRLAMELRRLRNRARRTIHEVAEAMECSPGKISRIETGVVGAQPRDVRDLLDIYGVQGAERERLLDLVRHARRRAWWHEYAGVVPPESARLYGLEDGAATIDGYNSTFLIPGLLQTEDYARALMGSAADGSEAAQSSERRIELRLRRQRLLTREQPPTVRFVLAEAALLAQVGGPRVLADQLRHLAKVATLPNVTIQVLPLTTGAHLAAGTVFTVFGFADDADPTIVYLEQLSGNAYVEAPKEVDLYAKAFVEATTKALSEQESRELICERADGLH
jgi:transcriptional regulator with XRE-family HTH domain